MTQNLAVDHYTFRNKDDSIRIIYDGPVSGTLSDNQSTDGPRLEYRGPEGDRIFPRPHDGPTEVTVQQNSPLGPLVSVILIPTVDAKSVTLTLLLTPVNMAGKDQQNFETVAIKCTRYGLLPRTGARLTYEVIHLQGTAYTGQNLPLSTESSAST
jgi:hypothetical protein